jgi:hypothetical protein
MQIRRAKNVQEAREMVAMFPALQCAGTGNNTANIVKKQMMGYAGYI